MYGLRLLVGVATAALSITAAAQTFITAPISSAAPASTFISSRASSTSDSFLVSATPSSVAGARIIDIDVGKHNMSFEPHEVTNVKKGDIIRFNFYPRGHSVARAEFEYPCYPWELYHPDDTTGGMWFSGEAYADANDSNNPLHWQFTLESEEPMFFYCSASTSCSEEHMVGVINPNATHSYEKQFEYAQFATYDLKPGQTWKDEDPNKGIPTPTPTPSTKPEEGGGKKSGLGAGAIAGIAIGAAAVVVIAAALLYLCGRRGGFDKAYRKSVIQPQGPAPDAAAAGGPTMVEAQYHNQHNPASSVPTPAGLKSPGQSSFATFSTHPQMDTNDPYRIMTASPQHPPYSYGTPPSPHQNPASPGSAYGFNTYNGHAVSTPGSPPIPGPNSPLMIGELSSVPHSRAAEAAPVELPSGDGPSIRPPSMLPGSPPPQYESGNNNGGAPTQNWTAGEENQFHKR